MSRLQNKQCPFFKSECLIGNCAMYDERLDNCLTSIVTFNMYKLANAIANATPEALQTQPVQGSYPSPQYRPG
jgi:hypothetical protein